MTGQLFGTDLFQCPYANIAGAQVVFNLVTGYFELSAGGMQNTRKSFWVSDHNVSAAKAPAVVAARRNLELSVHTSPTERIGGMHPPRDEMESRTSNNWPSSATLVSLQTPSSKKRSARFWQEFKRKGS